jgi:type IV pilus modification protein PilV
LLTTQDRGLRYRSSPRIWRINQYQIWEEQIVFTAQRKRSGKWSGGQKCGAGCSGFSLIEVLVASTVFSLGLAGFAALLLASIISSAEARRESIASMAAAGLSEQLRMNPAALDRYLNPPEYVSRICSGDNQCTPEQQADYDFRLWQLELADSIQNARGLICRDETPQDGVEGNGHCDGTGPLVIKIFWRGQGANDNGEPEQHRYTLEVS